MRLPKAFLTHTHTHTHTRPHTQPYTHRHTHTEKTYSITDSRTIEFYTFKIIPLDSDAKWPRDRDRERERGREGGESARDRGERERDGERERGREGESYIDRERSERERER